MILPKKIVCIFAHPDDESFACGGTLAYFAGNGVEVHEICVTSGDYPNDKIKGKKREAELQRSANILGVKNVDFLRFHDGYLSNGNYHEIADKIKIILEKIKPDSILTFDQNGVSGHLDHIAVSMISSYLFEKLKFIKNIFYYCEAVEIKKIIGSKYFVYFPSGYTERDVDWVNDVSSFFKLKIAAMKEHKTQLKDYLMIRTLFGKHLKKEYFKIIKKS